MTRHLKNIGQLKAAIASIYVGTFVLLALAMFSIIPDIIRDYNRNAKDVIKDFAIAENPVMWPLIGGAFVIDNVYNCAVKRLSVT